MTLAEEHDGVAFLCRTKGMKNRLSPVGNKKKIFSPDFPAAPYSNLFENCIRLFAAGVFVR